MPLHHLLLIEDNRADQVLASEVWESGNPRIKLHIVSDGTLALDFLFRKPPYERAPTPDLIVLDLGLPKNPGSDVLRKIKNDPSLKRIPVVILTTSGSQLDITKSYDLHANCYLMKPPDLNEYMRLLKSIENFWLRHTELPPRRLVNE